MKSRLIITLGIFNLILATSCSTPKDILYFKNIDDIDKKQLEQMAQNYTSRICPDDMLSINVSSWPPDVTSPFNLPINAYTFAQAAPSGPPATNSSMQFITYPVNVDGDIIFPVIGNIHAAGLSRREFEEKLQAEIRRYAPSAIVTIRIENYKITVLGDVLKPGTFIVNNERITILEAIGEMGDLNITANRKNILVIREENGRKEYGRIDLTDPNLFASPYYYLRQNDVVYVEPNKYKQQSAGTRQNESLIISYTSAIVSTMSALTTIILLITQKK